MKMEISIEEKAKRYDEALKVLHKYDGANIMFSQSLKEEMFPELKESESERIRRELLEHCKNQAEPYIQSGNKCPQIQSWVAWLEKQGEQKPCIIQWKGDNLKEVLDFTGKDKNFDKWFKSFEDYERYVHEHNNTFKLFNEDGSHYEVPVGAWIVKTPDGYNVASKAIFVQKPADKVEPKFKVKYAGSEYNVFETKDIAGVTFYGIEDEPNHIDYVKAENCEKISGYGIKENGSPFPTKPIMFSEEKPKRMVSAEAKEAMYDKSAWSEDDEIYLNHIVTAVKNYYTDYEGKENPFREPLLDWLKSLRPQSQWKPSERQKEALLWCVVHLGGADKQTLGELLEELNKL